MISISNLYENKQEKNSRTRCGIFIIKDNKVLVGDATDPSNPWKYKYILPGGKLEEGEKPIDCAKREAIEEITIVSKNIKLIKNKNNPITKCGLNKLGFKYDCYTLYYFYGEYDSIDKSVWGVGENGFKVKPIGLDKDQMVEWLKWCINQSKDNYRSWVFSIELEMVKELIRIGALK